MLLFNAILLLLIALMITELFSWISLIKLPSVSEGLLLGYAKCIVLCLGPMFYTLKQSKWDLFDKK